MGNLSKFVAAIIGAALVLFADTFGPGIGLPPDWSTGAMAVLSPVIVYLFPANVS